MKTMSILCNISPICTLISQYLKVLKSLQALKKYGEKSKNREWRKKKDWHFYIAYTGEKRGLSKAQFLSHNFHKSRPMLKSIYENITLGYQSDNKIRWRAQLNKCIQEKHLTEIVLLSMNKNSSFTTNFLLSNLNDTHS